MDIAILPFSKRAVWFCLTLTLLRQGLEHMDSNLSSGIVNEDGSNLTPPLHPRPWEAGAFSLTLPLIYPDW